MSWTSRLKKAVSGNEAPAPQESPEFALPPVAAVDPSTLSPGQIVEILLDDLVLISGDKLARSEIDPAGHIFDFGYVDSLSAVIFLARIEERFGTKIEDVELLDEASSLHAIAERVRKSG